MENLPFIKKTTSFFLLFFIFSSVIYAQDEQKEVGLKSQSEKFSFSPGVGLGYLIAPVDKSIPKEYIALYQKLKSGISFKGDFRLPIGKYFGVGAKYSLFWSSSAISIPAYTTKHIGDIVFKETFTTHSFGPQISFFLPVKESNFFVASSIPFIYHDDHATASFTDTSGYSYALYSGTLTGSTFGVCADAGVEIKINSKTYLGVTASMLAAVIKKMEYKGPVSNSTINQPNNISRFDIILTLRFV